ncbi:hypothetical protein QBC47DRAFT_401336 [Echria macrotheca]|uniref:F-box domain-containing protein n=1 Tax=Echria macrotheca TaxID=438768 RepID=A0AAJ0FCG3_9PEZI|nr:hypothetical protein QBC47DRAFT_401336 [Echria macrotheca]
MSILRLPDELLVEIVNPSATTDAAALSRVCHRFYRLSTPVLYRTLDIDLISRPSQAAALHRTLGKNDGLRAYCRVLGLRLPGDNSGVDSRRYKVAEDVVGDLISWATGTVELCIDGDYIRPDCREALWDAIRAAVRNMPNLEKLALGARDEKQVFLEDIRDFLAQDQGEKLRTLEIGIGVLSGYSTPMAVAPSQIGSSCITSLSVGYLLAARVNLAQLLLLPAQLEHFAFVGTSPGCYWSWSLFDLVSGLAPHQASLRTLRVAAPRSHEDSISGEPPFAPGPPVDYSPFKQLKGVTFTAPPA